MYSFQCTEEQLNSLKKMLDGFLKTGGLEVLQDAVNAYNVLFNAAKMEEVAPPVYPQVEHQEG